MKRFDFFVLTETWLHKPIHFSNLKCFSSTQNPNVRVNTVNGMISGGVLIFVKNNLTSKVSLRKSSTYFVWCQIDKEQEAPL